MPIYKVQPRNQESNGAAKPRLIKAARRAQVESMLIGEMAIEPADAEECVALGAAGVKIEEATLT